MSTTSNLIPLVVIAGVGAIGIVILKAKFAVQQGTVAKFKAKALLTSNEMEFLARLEAAAPELRFFSQVAMGALLDPAVPRSDEATAPSWRSSSSTTAPTTPGRTPSETTC